MEEKISLRGRTARKLVKVAHHLPFMGDQEKSIEIRNKITEHEKEWECPTHLKRTVMSMEQGRFEMELLQPVFGEEAGIILQLHGGGYYGRLRNIYRDMAARYHEVSGGCSVLSVDYRVAPEHPFPAALEDALCAYRWIIEKGYSPERLYVVGDSAGGGLALALVLYLRDHDMALPAGIITMSAWTDLTLSGASYQDNFSLDPIFGNSKNTLIYMNGYIGENDAANPYISPRFGNYAGFPPMLLQVGECEMLLSDTLSVAEEARRAGVDVQENTYAGMFHVFQMGLSLYPESEEAWNEIESFFGRLQNKEV